MPISRPRVYDKGGDGKLSFAASYALVVVAAAPLVLRRTRCPPRVADLRRGDTVLLAVNAGSDTVTSSR